MTFVDLLWAIGIVATAVIMLVMLNGTGGPPNDAT